MSVTVPRPAAPAAAKPFTFAKGLAIFGVLIAGYEAITWGKWLANGPQQVTEFRDSDATSFVVARFYEVAVLLVAIALTVKIVRECRAQRRMTFDAKFLIGGVAAMFWDPFANFTQPTFFYSSNWLNLNNWVGDAPLVINQDAGRMPEPVFIMLVYPFGLLAFTMITNAAMRRVRAWRPAWSGRRILAFGAVFATLCGMALEAPMFLLHLWSLPGSPQELSLFGEAHRYPIVEYLTTGMVFAGLAAMRYFKDDEGRTFPERGVSATGSVFAVIGWCASLLLVLQLIVSFFAFHADPYPEAFPQHLTNGMCDVGPTQNTRYGPCPGSDGFRMPGLRALPGGQPDEG